MIGRTLRYGLAMSAAFAVPAGAQGVFDMGALTNTLSIPTTPSPSPRPAPSPVPRPGRAVPESMADAMQAFRSRAPVIVQVVGDRLDGVDPDARFAALAGAQFDGAKASDATAAYTLLGWAIVHGQADLDPAAVDAVKAKSARLIAANPRMADPAARTAVARHARINAVIIATGARTASASGRADEYRDAVAAWFRGNGTDLARLTLTPAGLAAR